MATTPDSTRGKVRRHQERLHAQGLRPIRIRVPDVTSPAFRATARKQSRLVAGSPGEAVDQAFIDALSIDPDACNAGVSGRLPVLRRTPANRPRLSSGRTIASAKPTR